MYKALTVIALPEMVEREIYPGIKKMVPNGNSTRYEPGATITKKAFKDACQSDEDIALMIKEGQLSEDMDAELHPQSIPHDPLKVVPPTPEEAADDSRQ